MNILKAIHDPKLFAPWFEGGSWKPWEAFLCALFALPMDADALALFRRATGRIAPPSAPSDEAWLVCGRRSGKSFIASLIAVYLATFKDWSGQLSKGEVGTIAILAADRKQSRTIMRYCRALLRVPLLRGQVYRETAEAFELKNNIVIEIHTASHRTVRGYTLLAAILDEVAFWKIDEFSATPDKEVLNALRPAMATVEGAMLIALSSPYMRRGELWTHYRDNFGNADGPLIWQADTRTMNPTVPQKTIDEAYDRDPQSASAEYGAEFRSDLAGFLDDDVLDSCVDESRPMELPFQDDVQYHAFVDPSGGRGDAFGLSIAHTEPETDFVIVDVCRRRPAPFDPASVTAEFCDLLKSYDIRQVTGDKYGANWVSDAFAANGVSYQASTRNKSQIYVEVLPIFTTGRARLPNDKILINELRNLERRTSRSGDIIDHPSRHHDDLANSVAGALVEAGSTRVIQGEAFSLGRLVSSYDDPFLQSELMHLQDRQPWDY